jgi:hypothetical protein
MWKNSFFFVPKQPCRNFQFYDYEKANFPNRKEIPFSLRQNTGGKF